MILDKIRKKDMISSPETVNSDWTSPSISLDDREGEFSISLKYESGSSVNMKVFFQVSNNEVDFGDVGNDLGDGGVTITDSEGAVIFDLPGTGCSYGRIRIEVTTGSIDIVELKYVASQRH
jgi:hypothetical protein